MRTPGARRTICRVASMPLSRACRYRGRLRRDSARSPRAPRHGRCRLGNDAPSRRSSRIFLKPCRSTVWSSPSRTRTSSTVHLRIDQRRDKDRIEIVDSPRCDCRELDLYARAVADRAFDTHSSTQSRDPFANAQQTKAAAFSRPADVSDASNPAVVLDRYGDGPTPPWSGEHSRMMPRHGGRCS